jgi:hypothetical protein
VAASDPSVVRAGGCLSIGVCSAGALQSFVTVVAEVTAGDSWVTVSADVERFEAVSSGADFPLQWENRFGTGRITRFESPWRYCPSPDLVGVSRSFWC